MGKRERWKADRMWVDLQAKLVREAVVTQLEMNCIRSRYGTVAQWLALWQIFEVCAR